MIPSSLNAPQARSPPRGCEIISLESLTLARMLQEEPPPCWPPLRIEWLYGLANHCLGPLSGTVWVSEREKETPLGRRAIFRDESVARKLQAVALHSTKTNNINEPFQNGVGAAILGDRSRTSCSLNFWNV